MNHLKAYKGIAAAYRALNIKWQRHLKTHRALQQKHDLLASEDPVLAQLVDDNYKLVRDNRELQRQAKVMTSHNASLGEQLKRIRLVATRAVEGHEVETRRKSFWCAAFIALSVVEVCTYTYLYLV